MVYKNSCLLCSDSFHHLKDQTNIRTPEKINNIKIKGHGNLTNRSAGFILNSKKKKKKFAFDVKYIWCV